MASDNYTVRIKHKTPSFYNHFPDLGKMVPWFITGLMTGSYGLVDNPGEVLPFSVAQEFL